MKQPKKLFKQLNEKLLSNFARGLSALCFALLLSLLPIFSGSSAKAFDLPIAENDLTNWDLTYGKAWNSFSGIRSTTNYTAAIQTIWKLYGCYQGTVDGQSGRRTREAEALWLKFHEKKNGKGRPAEIFGSKQNYLKYLQNGTATVCETTEMVTIAENAYTCRLDDIGRNYLKKLARKPGNKNLAMAQQLAGPLQYVIKNYDTIFPSKDAPEITARNKEARDRMDTYGVKGVNLASTKKALIEAARTFRSLTLQYGHNPNKSRHRTTCGNCFKINSWKYLENLAQSRGGRLFNSEDPTFNVKVDDFTTAMISEVADNILVHRRMTAKWLELVDKDQQDYQVSVPDPNNKGKFIYKEVDRDELDQQRTEEMDRLIGILLDFVEEKKAEFKKDIYKNTKIDDLIGMKMSKLAAKYKCVGFDGSSIYGEK